jgi:hypothetical protein
VAEVERLLPSLQRVGAGNRGPRRRVRPRPAPEGEDKGRDREDEAELVLDELQPPRQWGMHRVIDCWAVRTTSTLVRASCTPPPGLPWPQTAYPWCLRCRRDDGLPILHDDPDPLVSIVIFM